jgi:hypothetical protein
MFSRKFDVSVKMGIAIAGTVAACVFTVVFFGVRNDVADVGYRPQQPVPFSHQLHAKQLQISCQYCHAGVEVSAHSPVPSTQTCMNCHTLIKAESPRLQVIRDAYEKNSPVEWVRVHKVPDYAHFNHSRHIRAQIDCKSCHGPIEEMGVVSQYKPLSMGWCLDCHRNPEANIVGARPISGVFTGTMIDPAKLMSDSTAAFQPIKAQIVRNESLTTPRFGQDKPTVPKVTVAGIPHPKVAGLGPENCSSCHY